MKSGFESLKSFFPSFYASSKKSIGNMVSSLTMSESEYLYKTETTEKEIVSLLMSKMDMEIILGLKLIISNIQSDKDISAFMPRIFEIFIISKDYYTKQLCLCIIDNLTLQKRSELLLLYNVIAKCSHDPDVLNRMSLLHMIASLKSQDIASECSKMLLPFTADSNPLLRRMAMIVIVNYIKLNGDNMQITHEDFDLILKKYLADPHPMVSSSIFYAVSELANSDYLSLMLHNYFDNICEMLSKYDDYYFERTVYCLINFGKIVLFHNIEKNIKYVMKLFNSLYNCSKHSTEPGKILCSLYGIYKILKEISKFSLHTKWKEGNNLFKEHKQLKKIAKILVHLMIQTKNCPIKEYLALNLIKKYVISGRNNEYFALIKKEFNNYINYFYIQYLDTKTEYIPFIKLDIISELATEVNIKTILEDFKRTLNYSSNMLKKKVIISMEEICNISKGNEQIVPICIERMIEFLKLKDEVIINQVILSLSQLITEVKEQKRYVLIYSIKNFKKSISSPYAKANIIWMISNCILTIPTVIIDFYRRLLQDIDKERNEIKMQIIGLTYKIHENLDHIISAYQDSKRKELKETIEAMMKYLVDKMLYDNDYVIREKARIVNAFIHSGVKMNAQDNDNQLQIITSKTIDKKKKKEKILQKKTKQFLFSLGYLSEGLEKSLFKFNYDVIDPAISEKMQNISLDELIKATCPKEAPKEQSPSPNIPSGSTEKYASCSNENNIGNEVSNFNSGLNIEEKKQALKNQLDEFLNGDDDDDDEVVVEFKQDK